LRADFIASYRFLLSVCFRSFVNGKMRCQTRAARDARSNEFWNHHPKGVMKMNEQEGKEVLDALMEEERDDVHC